MKLSRVLVSMVAAFAAAPALAQEAEAVTTAAASASGWAYIGAAIAISLAVIGGTAGQGKAAAAAFEGIGRNPQSSDKMFTPLLLGLALIEFQTIMAFIIAILLVNK